MTDCYHVSTAAFYCIAWKKGWIVTAASHLWLYEFNKEQDYVLYSNRIDIVDFLGDNALMELYRLSPLDFEKFMRPKKELIKEELYKLLYKVYYDFIDIFLKKVVDMLPLY